MSPMTVAEAAAYFASLVASGDGAAVLNMVVDVPNLGRVYAPVTFAEGHFCGDQANWQIDLHGVAD